jgi:branched-chain amino acid transport system ATP-binding protein
MLRIRNVCKKFGGIHALGKVSLNLDSGKIWSLIGPNGAGKTTLFNLITGSLSVDSGEIEFMSEDITNAKPYKICRKGIANLIKFAERESLGPISRGTFFQT